MKKYLKLFSGALVLILAVACTLPDDSATTAPEDPSGVTFGAGAAGLQLGGRLDAAAQTTLRGANFQINYTFPAGKWKSGLTAVLYLGTTKIATATNTGETDATFDKLPTDVDLLAGGDLVLKFEDAGTPSAGVPLLDNTQPTITKAELVNTTVTLTMSEALAARTALANTGGFVLTGSGVTTPTTFAVTGVAAVAADAKEVKLTITGEPQDGETVKVHYVQPTADGDQIKDKAGFALATIAAADAISVAVKADTTAPTIEKAEHDGTTVALTLSEALGARDESTDTGGFTLTGTVATGTATVFTVTKVAAVTVGDKTVTLTVDNAAQAGETVKLSYAQPADAAKQIKDKAGNALASIAKENAVDVTKKLSDAKQLTAFSFAAAGNDALTADVTGTVTQPATAGANGTIAVTVPNNTVVTALKATFAASAEATVSIGTAAQTSGTTANDFTNPVTYTVKAENDSTQNYVVTVTVEKSDAKQLTAFSFAAAGNDALTADVTGTVTQPATAGANGTIAVTVPNNTVVTALKATFAASAEATVSIGTAAQTSGTTANDFTNPVTYTVKAENDSTQNYIVTVTVEKSDAKQLTAFSFAAAGNDALTADVTGTVTQPATAGANGTIAVTVPNNTVVTALKATFTASAEATVSIGTAAQTSGTTANDFTNPVTYTVKAENDSTQNYVVTVTVEKSDAKQLTAFSFAAAGNDALTADVTGTVTQPATAGANGTIAVTVPNNTVVTALKATFAASAEATVSIGTAAQTSGTTANDFTNPVTYTVKAENDSTQNYIVTVTVEKSDAKQLTAFSFAAADNTALTADVAGTITEPATAGANGTIAVTVPNNTVVTALKATFTASAEATVSVGTAAQTSGTTENDFTNPVTYTVKAEDDSAQNYVVTVTVQ